MTATNFLAPCSVVRYAYRRDKVERRERGEEEEKIVRNAERKGEGGRRK